MLAVVKGATTMTNIEALIGAIEYLSLAHGEDNEDVNAIMATLAAMVDQINSTSQS